MGCRRLNEFLQAPLGWLSETHPLVGLLPWAEPGKTITAHGIHDDADGAFVGFRITFLNASYFRPSAEQTIAVQVNAPKSM